MNIMIIEVKPFLFIITILKYLINYGAFINLIIEINNFLFSIFVLMYEIDSGYYSFVNGFDQDIVYHFIFDFHSNINFLLKIIS
jgi:hypothetical protein